MTTARDPKSTVHGEETADAVMMHGSPVQRLSGFEQST
jgi:hypothetical protein